MFQETISDEYIVIQSGTSEGSQIKYRKDNYWYKKDNRGHEGRTEYLCSKLLSFSTLEQSEYVEYEQGYINQNMGCRSKNFLNPGEELITFYRLYYNEFGKDLSEVIGRMETMEERIEYVVNFIKQTCLIDITDYMKKILTLDWIILNEDRHLNNLAVVFRDGIFVPAPIFDNGVSLLTANLSVNWNFSIEDNVKRVIARPFCGSHEKMLNYFGKGFELNVSAALEWLDKETNSREKEVLMYQIKKFQKI